MVKLHHTVPANYHAPLFNVVGSASGSTAQGHREKVINWSKSHRQEYPSIWHSAIQDKGQRRCKEARTITKSNSE